MKQIILSLLFLALVFGCEKKETRYTTESDNIDLMKSGLQSYVDQDWDTWKSNYADDAEIYSNNWDTALSTEEVLTGHKSVISNLSDYHWRAEPQFFEQTIDNEGKTWVNFWGVWEGTLKNGGKEIMIPVHLSSLFEDGKVVEEYGFWNMAEYQAELDKTINTPVGEQKLLDLRDRFLKEFLNNQENAVLDDILAENFVRYMNGEKESEGKQGLIEGMGVFNQGFPDLQLSNSQTVIKDNTIYTHWTFTGTNTGEFLGQPATSKKVKIDGMSELKFNSDGKLYEEHVFFNQLDMLEQLGYTLTPPSS